MADEEASRFEEERLEVQAGKMAEDEKAELLTLLADGDAEAALHSSTAGRIGHAMEPILKPMGFDWKIGTTLIGAFAAKEVFPLVAKLQLGNTTVQKLQLR